MVQGRLRALGWLLAVLCIGSLAAAGLLARAGGADRRADIRPLPEKAVYEVGILQGDTVPEQEKLREGFLAALASEGWEDGKNLRIELLSGGGNAGALQEGADAFRREKKDLVAAVGTDAARTAAAVFHTTPVVGMGVLNFKYARWMEGHRNFTGVMSLPAVVRQFDAARRVLEIRRLGVLYSEDNPKAEMQLRWLRAAAARKQLSLAELPVPASVPPETAAASLAGQADAVYIAIDGRMQTHFSAIAAVLTAAGIPIVGSDDDMVRRGAVLSVSEDYYRMGFAAGKAAAKLLSRRAVPQNLPIIRQTDPDLVVNMAALSRLQLGLPGDIWQKARKLYLYDGQPARP